MQKNRHPGQDSVMSHKIWKPGKRLFEENSFIIFARNTRFSPGLCYNIKLRMNKEEKTHGFSAARRVLFGRGLLHTGALQTADAGSRVVLPDPQMDE